MAGASGGAPEEDMDAVADVYVVHKIVAQQQHQQ